jgi:hypothetical protein
VRRLSTAAKRFYQPELLPEETVRDVVAGYAAGADTRILLGAVAGTLFGWLGAIYLAAAALPALVLGGCVGIIAGYYGSARASRRPGGPGAVEMWIVLTSARLLTMRRHGAVRRKVLRSYDLAQVLEATVRRYPLGRYHRQRVIMKDGTTGDFIVARKLPIEPLNADPSSR